MAEIDLEQAKSSEEPGTLAAMREKHRQSRQVLTGHPNDPALTEKPEETEDELPQGKDVQPPPEEKVEATPEPAPTPAPAPEQPPAIAQPEAKKFKYASQEEAERAQEEAARKMHEATAELAELKKRMGEAPPPPQESPRPASPEEIENKVAKTWEEIDNLDPYDDDYYSKRAKLFTNLLNLGATTPGTDPEVARQAAREEWARIQAEEQAKKETQAQEQASRNAAVEIAKQAGLNMQDEAVNRLFWDALNRAPYYEGVTLQQQVEFMVSEVKRLNVAAAREKGASAPEPAVLERGSRTPVTEPDTEEGKPRKLSDIKEKWRQQRQI